MNDFLNGLLRHKVQGAVRYCTAKKLYKKWCLYGGDMKYLVLVSDTVQYLLLHCEELHGGARSMHVCGCDCTLCVQGNEKLCELEELMEEAGGLEGDSMARHIACKQRMSNTFCGRSLSGP